MTAAPRVPNMQARGTSRFGFSTADEFCAADSMPRNAHRVSEMLDPMPPRRDRPWGFQASAKTAGLKKNHPMIESTPTGMITPQTVIAPMRPVTLGPPKLAAVVSQISTITPRQVAIGVAERNGMNEAR